MLTNHQIDGIRIMRKRLLACSFLSSSSSSFLSSSSSSSSSYDEVWTTLRTTSDAINLDVPSILLWQEEGQKRRNALFYFIDEGEEGTFFVSPFLPPFLPCLLVLRESWNIWGNQANLATLSDITYTDCFWVGETAVAMQICKILVDAKDKETLQELVDATCYIHGEETWFRDLAERKGCERILGMLEGVGCPPPPSTSTPPLS